MAFGDPERTKSCAKHYAARTDARRHRGQRYSSNWEKPMSEGVGRLLVLTGLPGSGKTNTRYPTGCIIACVPHVP